MTALIPHPYLPGMAEAWISASADERDSGAAYAYAITRAEDGLLVGAIDLRRGAETADSLGYWVGRPYWGNGYATAAACALIAVAFARLDIDRLGAIHLARNPASGRVMEKCGMTLTRRGMRPHRDGAPEEFCVWSMGREAWEERIRASL